MTVPGSSLLLQGAGPVAVAVEACSFPQRQPRPCTQCVPGLEPLGARLALHPARASDATAPMADDASRGTSCNQRQRPCTQAAVALPAGGSLRGRGLERAWCAGREWCGPNTGGRQRCQVREDIVMGASWAWLLTTKFEGRAAADPTRPSLSILGEGGERERDITPIQP